MDLSDDRRRIFAIAFQLILLRELADGTASIGRIEGT